MFSYDDKKADAKKFIQIYEGSKSSQKFVKEFEASELVVFEESSTEQSYTSIVTRSIQGDLAEVIRTILQASEAASVGITLVDKNVRDDESASWQGQVILRVEVGGASVVIISASYYGVLAELLEWLATV